MAETAAILLCILLASLTVFQLALILGAPIGRYAWGGQHATLPMRLKIGSVTSIVLYAVIAMIVLNQANIITFFDRQTTGSVAIWVLVVYFTVGIPLNAASRSKPERNVMTPLVAVLMVLTLTIALA